MSDGFLLLSPFPFPFPDDDDELACESCVSASVSSGASITAARFSFSFVVDSSVLFNLDKFLKTFIFRGYYRKYICFIQFFYENIHIRQFNV